MPSKLEGEGGGEASVLFFAASLRIFKWFNFSSSSQNISVREFLS